MKRLYLPTERRAIATVLFVVTTLFVGVCCAAVLLCSCRDAHADGVDSSEIRRMRVALESIAESARKCR